MMALDPIASVAALPPVSETEETTAPPRNETETVIEQIDAAAAERDVKKQETKQQYEDRRDQQRDDILAAQQKRVGYEEIFAAEDKEAELVTEAEIKEDIEEYEKLTNQENTDQTLSTKINEQA